MRTVQLNGLSPIPTKDLVTNPITLPNLTLTPTAQVQIQNTGSNWLTNISTTLQQVAQVASAGSDAWIKISDAAGKTYWATKAQWEDIASGKRVLPPPSEQPTNVQTTPKEKDNTILYISIGAGSLILIALLIMFSKKTKSK
jgi:hypothetical protein